ncbi:MAG: hypothetical protein ACFE9P_08405 [Candidatus Hermodarchaeota archaeon]
MWHDYRSGTDYDIYVQRIDSNGIAQWIDNGTAISTVNNDQRDPQIISDGRGGAIIVWNDYRSGTDYDIYAQRIASNGIVQWTTNGIAISTASEDQIDPQLTSDGAGGAIIAWWDARSIETSGYDIYAQRIDSNGITQWMANGTIISTETHNQMIPQMTCDGVGGAIIAWQDYRSGTNLHIYAQRINHNGITQWIANGTVISIASGSQLSPRITSDGGGGAIIAWKDSRSGVSYDIYAQRIDANGIVQWTANGTSVCAASGTQENPQIINDGAGGGIITWWDYRSSISGQDIYAQRIDSKGNVQWTVDGMAISTASGSQLSPKITSDGVGGAIIVWSNNAIGGYDIYAQRIDSEGNPQYIGNGTAIITASGEQVDVQITNNGKGDAIITWEDFRSGLFSDIYSTLIDSNGIPKWTANGKVICTAISDQYSSQITSDGTGGGIITWWDFRSGTNSDIYAQRINHNGITQWIANGTVISMASGHQWTPQIASDGIGGAVIVWEDFRSGSNWDIYAQRIDSNGMVKWTANGTIISTAINDQRYLQIISDGLGGAIIAWEDTRNGVGNSDIYAQRIDSDGASLWMANGTAVSTANENQRYLQLTSDGAGGAIIAWGDYRSGTDYDIYVQRIDSNGITQWAANGTALCTAINHQFRFQIAPDGLGGAIIAWEDARNGTGNSDIYAQRIDSNGVTLWMANGIAISTASESQGEPQITSDGLGGAIIAWGDYRSDFDSDIYTQRIDSNGNAQWMPNGTAISTSINDQISPQITKHGVGGAIIVWEDFRSGSNCDIYAQRIDSNGMVKWTANGTFISLANNDQNAPKMINDGVGGAIITWSDLRSGSHADVYAQRIRSSVPTSNHPNSIITFRNGSETINWTLYDDLGGGMYRVLANNTVGNFYTCINWTPWESNTLINVPINRSAPGTYEYTIEYYDYHIQYGIPNIVIVTIVDRLPRCTHPISILIDINKPKTINWTLIDDFGAGKYRILANNTVGNFYIWKNWTTWYNNSLITVPVNITNKGIYSYTIEYFDDRNQFGIPDTVTVTITDLLGPIITIISPNPNNNLFGKLAPNFIVKIEDLFLDAMWYSLDGGITNTTFTNNGSIYQTLWDTVGNGTVTIKFYANDTDGNIGIKEIKVRKDILGPIITIHDPTRDDEFYLAPVYELSMIEGNLDKIWYTLDEGNTNISISSLVGIIDQELWEEISPGAVWIRFYANDTLGNLGWEDVFIYKIRSPQDGIPGEWLILIITSFLGIAIISTVILITKQKIRKSRQFKKEKSIAKNELTKFEDKMSNFIITKLKEYYNEEWFKKGIPDNIKTQIEKIKKLPENI